ncbi:unnamed protein product, partial [Brugia pahangi]|uniref:RING-type domain-containing protein n=1 Tax=Brugia pahangi TaxID=6280 RepID=A0A0N4T3X7_BRUPA
VSRTNRLRRHSSDCSAEDKSRIIVPCNHICVCADCVEELLEIYEEPLCSLCRSIISSYVDVYI